MTTTVESIIDFLQAHASPSVLIRKIYGNKVDSPKQFTLSKSWGYIFLSRNRPMGYALLFLLIFPTGCQMYDPIIKEMDSAYAKSESDDDVTTVVQKYFQTGAEFDKVLPLLKQLKEDGFEISEYKYGVGRDWPDGEFNSPPNELVKLSLERRYPTGTKGFVLEKIYDIQMLIVTKTAVISFKVDTVGKLFEVEGHIYISAI